MNWEKEFDRLFVHENPWEEKDGETKFVAIGNIKAFIHSVISSMQHTKNGTDDGKPEVTGKRIYLADAFMVGDDLKKGLKDNLADALGRPDLKPLIAKALGSLGGKARAKSSTKAQRKKWGKLGGRPKNKVL